ncbi:ABC transporter C-terminal domain-containing protein, partial [Parasphingorhabdus sp.]
DGISGKSGNSGTKNSATAKPGKKSSGSSPAKKLSYKDQRDYDMLPGRIEAIERRMGELSNALSDPDLYSRDFEKFEKLTAENTEMIEEKDRAEMRWLDLAEQVEALENAKS